MRIGIVTDSCCDLPRSFIDRNGIVILPITISSASQQFIDNRNPGATLEFYWRIKQGETTFESAPLSVEEIRSLFLERLVVEYDYIFCLTVMASRSRIHEYATQASFGILNSYKPVREAAGVGGPFSLRVFDTGTLFPGQGLIVAEVARLVREERSTLEIIRHIEMLQRLTQAFLIPENLDQLRRQARSKGDKSVGLASYLLGSALDIKPIIRGFQGQTEPVGRVRGFESGAERLFAAARQQIEAGLMAPTICVSYGGEIDRITALPGWNALVELARERGVTIHVAEMSATAAVNIGVDGLALAFASTREARFD